MKLYIVYAYGPDMYEGDDALFGVFDSKEEHTKALQKFGKEIDFEFEDGTFEVREVTLNEAAV
jgi:hypothetical protein